MSRNKKLFGRKKAEFLFIEEVIMKLLCFVLLTWFVSGQTAVQGVKKTLVVAPGYSLEEYFAETSDGYILKIFRIPGSPKSPPTLGKKVVFLMHALFCSAHDWIVLGPRKALAYLLADAGFDVWLGNARGNTFSRKHKTLSPNDTKFWDFSFHEIGTNDLPTMIDFVLRKTKQPKLHYVGHYLGSTAFFVMGSERPDYNKKIISMHALSPAAYMNHLVSPVFRFIALLYGLPARKFAFRGYSELSPNDSFLAEIGKVVCKTYAFPQEICANIMFLVCGFDSEQLDRKLLPQILAYVPAGASSKQVTHFSQEVNSGHFRQFDYNPIGNVQKYGSMLPPGYRLAKVTAPVYLHWSGNDWLSAETDVKRLSKELGNLVEMRKVPFDKWNHLDYIYGTNASDFLYKFIVSEMLLL